MFDALFPSHWSDLQKLMWLKILKGGLATWETITGNPVSFTAKAAPLRKLEVAFSPVQAGSGDPSPDNVRPISGWDSLNVEQRGKNLCGGTIAGTGIGAGGRIERAAFDMHYGKVKKGATYTVTTDEAQLVCGFFYAEPVNGAYSYDRTRTVQNSKTIVAPIDGYLAFRTSENYAAPQLELGSTASEYEPYNPLSRSISISLGSTVYSGMVDVVTGVGTVTHKSVDLGSLNWTKGNRNSDDTGYVFYSIGLRPELSTSADSYCSIFAKPAEPLNAWERVKLNNYYIFLNDVLVAVLDVEDAASFKTAVTGAQFVYGIDEPITISLTPQEVQSLAGDNVLFSDANGDLTVEYRSN